MISIFFMEKVNFLKSHKNFFQQNFNSLVDWDGFDRYNYDFFLVKKSLPCNFHIWKLYDKQFFQGILSLQK